MLNKFLTSQQFGLWLAGKLIFISLLILVVTGCQQPNEEIQVATKPVILHERQEEYPLGRHLEILEDTTRELTIEDVSAGVAAESFVPSQEAVPNIGFTDSAYWTRFDIRNGTAELSSWYIELNHPFMRLAELYYPTQFPEIYEVTELGRSLPFDDRDVFHQNLVFQRDIPPGAMETVYMRFESDSRLTLPLTLWVPEAFAERDRVQQFFWGAIYGVLLIAACYFLFLFLSLKDRTYLYLTLFIIGLLLTSASFDGRITRYLPFDGQLFSQTTRLELFFGLTLIFLLLFSRAFLKTGEYAARMNTAFNILIAGLVAVLCLSLFLDFQQSLILLLLMAVLALLAVGGATLVSLRRGYPPARLFALAYASLFVVGLIGSISRFGVLPGSWLPNQAVVVAGVVMVVLLSFSVASRINFLQVETEASNQALRASEHRLNQYLDSVPFGIITFDPQLSRSYINQRAKQFAASVNSTIGELIGGDNAYAILKVAGEETAYPQDELPPLQALEGEDSTIDDVELEVGGARIPLEISASPVFDEEGEVEYVLTVFRDIRKRLEQERLRYESETRLASILEISADAIISIDEAQRIRHVNSGAAQVFGYSPEELLGQPVHMLLPEAFRAVHHQHIEGFGEAGELVRNMAVDRPREIFGRRKSGELFPAEASVSMLMFDGQPVYTVFLRDISERRAAEKLRQEAVIAERNRLARDLHDAVTQTLFSASLIAEALPIQWQYDREGALGNLDKLRRLTRGALAEMRTLLLELRPEALTNARLQDLLLQLAQSFESQSNVPMDFTADVTWDGTLPPDVQIAFYRIAQETCNNIAKHAEASQVAMHLIYSAEAVELRCTDDGKGFDPEDIPAGHFGVGILAERAEDIGATLEIESLPGQGTQLQLFWMNSEGNNNHE